MANKISGRVLLLTPTETLPTKNGKTYSKRELVIERTIFDKDTGLPTTDPTDTPVFRIMGQGCSEVDSINPGDNVTVHYELQGRSYDKDGVKKYFTDIRVFRVDKQSHPSIEHPAVSMTVDPTPIYTESQTESVNDDGDLPF